MSVLVSVSNDVENALVSTVASVHPSPSSFTSSATASLTSSYASFLSLFAEKEAVQAVMGLEGEDAEAVVAMVSGLIKKVEDEGKQLEIEGKLVSSITSSTSGSPESKLRMIVNLYNLRPPSSSYSLLLSAISYAGSTNQMPLLSPSLSNLPSLISTLPITESETRALYLTLSKAFDAFGDKTSGRSAMVKYLLTFTPSSPMTPSDRETVKAAVRDAIANPMMLWGQGTSFGDLPCVGEVKKDSDFEGVGSLLDVLEEGKFCDWQEWKKKYGGRGEGINLERCEEAMRLLSICSLASEKGEIPFGDISDTLEVPEESVERWVVKAIAEGLMKGKIDQVKKSVVVERSVARKFGKEEWGRLRDTIGEWKVRVKKTEEELKGRQKKN